MYLQTFKLGRLLVAVVLAVLPALAHADPVTIASLAVYAAAALGANAVVVAWAMFAIPAVGLTFTRSAGSSSPKPDTSSVQTETLSEVEA